MSTLIDCIFRRNKTIEKLEKDVKKLKLEKEVVIRERRKRIRDGIEEYRKDKRQEINKLEANVGIEVRKEMKRNQEKYNDLSSFKDKLQDDYEKLDDKYLKLKDKYLKMRRKSNKYEDIGTITMKGGVE